MRSKFKAPISIGFAAALSIALLGCGSDGGTPASNTSQPTAKISAISAVAAAVTCTTGTWQVANEANQVAPVKSQSTHFAIRYDTGNATTAQATTIANQLESNWTYFIGTVGFPEPYCATATKYKINVTINPTYGLSGGLDGQGFPGMWVGPAVAADHWGLAHEFSHALQGSSGGLRDSPYSGWIWEDHANWMSHQLAEYKDNYHCTELFVNAPHIYYGSTRNRYCSFQFFDYLRNTYGYSAVNNIWKNAPQPGNAAQATADPISILATNMGWSASQLNNVFGNWAMRNINWEYTDPSGYNQGPAMRSSYGSYDSRDNERALRVTTLDPLDLANRRFNVPFYQAPQRYGYNIIRVIPDSGATSITVTFRGVLQSAANTTTFPGLNNEPTSVPPPNSDWRWGIVAINSAGNARYGTLKSGSDSATTFALQTGDQAVYMVVVATPSAIHRIKWDQPYYSIYRYPYMIGFTNAYPQGFQPGAPAPFANSHQHTNGGGWVSNTATVASTAYVGPYAQVRGGSVTGNARIQEHAIIMSGTVQGNAVVGGATVVNNGVTIKDNAVVQTSFMGPGFFEPNAVIGGTAQLRGDVELRGGPTLTQGVYSGFVDQASNTDPAQGSTRTAPITEVTAPPNLTWR